jgi:hypothetical protein
MNCTASGMSEKCDLVLSDKFKMKKKSQINISYGLLRRLDHIVPAHLFRAWLSRLVHHKTMLLSAKCNGKVRERLENKLLKKHSEH